MQKSPVLNGKVQSGGWVVAKQLLNFWQNLKLKAKHVFFLKHQKLSVQLCWRSVQNWIDPIFYPKSLSNQAEQRF